MKVFNSLGSNYNFISVIRHLLTPYSNESCKKLNEYLENKYQARALLFYKGRQALEYGLKLLKLNSLDIVAVTGFTCFVVNQAIKNAGLAPVYLDLAAGGLNFSSVALEKAVKKHKKIRAVIIQNTLGAPSKIDAIKKICSQYNIFLIEDLAHGADCVYGNGESAGTVGDMAILSFSQDKLIDTVSGGALIVNNKDIKIPKNIRFTAPPKKIQIKDYFYPMLTLIIRSFYPLTRGMHAIFRKYSLLSSPINNISRKIQFLPNRYCSLVLIQLSRLKFSIRHRQIIASVYINYLPKELLISDFTGNLKNTCFLRFPILVRNREALLLFLKNHGVYIEDVWYDSPISPKKYMAKTDYTPGLCPNAETVSQNILNLPTHKNITYEKAKKITDLIVLWMKS